MNLKTFRAPSMAQALSEVKKDLGKDAVILHTRSYKVGAVMGMGGKQMIEITAADHVSARGPTIKATRPQTGEAFTPGSFPTLGRTGVAVAEPPSPVPPSSSAEAESPVVTTRPVKVEDIAPRREAPAARPAPLAIKATFAPDSGEAVASLRSELASIKRLVGQVLQCSRQTAASVTPSATAVGVVSMGGMPEPLFAHYLRLQDAHVAHDIADALIGKVRDELTPDELASGEIVRQVLLRHLAALIPVTGSMGKAGATQTGRPLTIALVGPTGVGKTTTIAKLAAAYKLRQGKKVGLITSDTYRIAAVDQLRTYANIIGLPLKVALTPREMAGACSALADCDAILIDTAGRSQHDKGRLEELGVFVEASMPDETHLVLSATVAEPVLNKAADKFAVLKPSRVIFSKLDEAVHFGVLVNTCKKVGMPVSYVTTGQEVPDEIELAQSERLARLVLDGELAVGSRGSGGSR
jgi:flagellar biosynthesis protein FlhF